MGNKAYTIEEQLTLLKKRGLQIDDDEKAKEVLLDVGYYRLGFYSYHFQDKRTHQFQENIHLDALLALYYFDVDLKNLLLRYIYRIEVHFRTQLIYHASNYYKNNPAWYADPKIINDSILKEFNNIYFNLKKNHKVIRKHHQKYNCINAPAWKTFEFLTFGQVYKFFTSLKDNELQKIIANAYDLRSSKLLDNYFKALINIRNICSHNAVLYDYRQPKGIKKIPHEKYCVGIQSSSINASLQLILFLLSKISNNRARELEQELRHLIAQNAKNPLIKHVIDHIMLLDWWC